MASFVDRVLLHVAAGAGGDGCSSVRREKFVPLGGPDGGDGGRGGDVIAEVDASVTTLLDFHHHPHQRAANGRPGQGSHRKGADGADIVLRVPNGTVIVSEDGTEQLGDLIGVGTRHVIARGGRGGLGNAALASPRRRVPGFALLGEPGQALTVRLELKTVADVALIGFPNAGKSSLVSVLSAARPKIADYPFTTLAPNLGVVSAGEHVFTVADVPGLIPGASTGRGLGLEFLRHVERCSVLVHVLDAATLEPGRDPESDLDVIEAELAAYGRLTDRPRLVAINKTDVPDARELAEIVTPELTLRGLRVFPISAATGQGVRALALACAELVEQERLAHPPPLAPRIVLRPRAVRERGFSVAESPEGGYVVHGERPARWVAQTDFSNDEAVGYLADRLARLGVEEDLAKLGATPGAAVTIGEVTFDWYPASAAADEESHVDSEPTLGPRGSDERLLTSRRLTRKQRDARREAQHLPTNVPTDVPTDGTDPDPS